MNRRGIMDWDPESEQEYKEDLKPCVLFETIQKQAPTRL
jgi:hypothetical protein